MHPSTPETLPLLCPRCHNRALPPQSRHQNPLKLTRASRHSAEGEVLDGILTCRGCSSLFPIVDGIPILFADMKGFMTWASVFEGEPAPEVTSLLLSYGPDTSAEVLRYDGIAMYVDAAWGDRATPQPDVIAGPPNAGAQIGERLLSRAESPVERALELGVGMGRGLAELSRGAKLVVGVDITLGYLRVAKRLLAGEAVVYQRRMNGNCFEPATVQVGEWTCKDAVLICADALNPPLVPGTFGRIASTNLVDKVSSPIDLMAAMDELAEPGGEVIVTTPLQWNSSSTPEVNWLGTLDSGAAITHRYRNGVGLSGPYTIEECVDLPWSLRYNSRHVSIYNNYYLRARKPS
jgi:uncharacterized protein YbaR (Trm112 family)